MGLIDMFLPKDQIAKAEAALKGAELERKNKIRQTLAMSGVNNETLVEKLVSVSAQAPSLRVAAEASGKGALAEILIKIAEKLDGR